LHAVGVMHVGVHIGHPAHPGLKHRGDGQRGVVVDTEAGGRVGHRVVQAAAEVDRAINLAVGDRPRRGHRSAGDQRRALVHAREDRIIRCAEPVPDREQKTRSRCPAHGVDVTQGVDQTQRRDVSRLRGQDVEAVDDAQRPGQEPGQLPPQRMHRVLPAEVVTEHPRIPHHQGPVHW